MWSEILFHRIQDLDEDIETVGRHYDFALVWSYRTRTVPHYDRS